MIPKEINQIWIGDPKKMPKEWMDTWKRPGWKYIFWNEKEIDSINLVNREKYDYFYKKGIYDGAADIARVEILARFGGVYIDADSICLEPIDDLLESEFFAGIEYDRRIANGIMGSEEGHTILLDYLERQEEATIIEPPCYTIGGTMLTSCVDSYGRDKVLILPQFAFYPNWRRRGAYKGKIYARHMWWTTKKYE